MKRIMNIIRISISNWTIILVYNGMNISILKVAGSIFKHPPYDFPI